MSDFQRPLSGFRLVDVLHGDTLQQIAAREMGDATRWVDLANINELVPPYITDNAAEAGANVLLSGGVLLVPARNSPAIEAGTSEAAIYGTSIALSDGKLSADEDGRLVLVSGRDNLKQALVNRVDTERGDLVWHPSYGAIVRALLGVINGPSAGLVASQYVAASIRADYRVKSVESTKATMSGDQIMVECNVVPVTGKSMKIEAVI